MDQPQEMRPLRGRARLAKAGVIVSATFSVMLAASHFGQALALGQPLDAAPPGFSKTVVAFGMCCSGIGVLGCLLVSSTLFLLWFHRAVANANASGRGVTFSPGEAVGYWFVPFVNLFRPYQMMAELDRAVANDQRDEAVFFVAADVRLWWGLWIGAGIVSWSGSIEAFGVLGNAMGLGLSAAGRVACAFVLIRIINRITNRLEGESVPARF